ncbi:hypothetical protein V1514DRAFT_327464 [Lipomyces japonicus]|uniref:uncharacterized protein n=1 Tax=Lipomyces japonicus TaxID=56871 RepID=UPI0034CFE9B6
MSVAYKNPFSLLVDDAEEADTVPSPAPAPKLVVKSTTSSKKADQPPKSAKPENARPSRPSRNANEDAIRNKGVGRSANRNRGVPAEGEANSAKTARANRGKRQFDRQSNAPRDSQKQVEESWGSNSTELKDEVASKADANAELTSADATDAGVADAEVPEEDNSKTLEEYLEELKLKTAELGPKPTIRKLTEDTSSWGTVVNHEEPQVEEDSFFAGLKPKRDTVKSKKQKEKVVIEFEPQFVDPNAASRRGRGGPRGGARNGGRGGRNNGPRGGARNNGASTAPVTASVTASAKIDLSSTTDFPALS